MAIFLTILKIIGIILLVILGLVLLIILLVLFSPISYRISAKHNDDETVAQAKVGFLIVNGLVSFIKGEGLDYYVKLLFFKVYPGKKKKGKGKGDDTVPDKEDDLMSVDLPDEEELAALEGNVPDSASSNEDLDSDDADEASVDDSDAENSDADDEASEDDDSSGKGKKKKGKKKKDKKKDKKKKDKKEKGEKKSLSDTIDEILDMIDVKLDKADAKYVETMTKLDHVDQFLHKPYVQKTIARALKIVKRLLGTIKPKKSKGYLHMGLGSAADTGMMLGKIAAFYPLYARWLTIEPDFYYKVIEGDIDIKGRIYLFRFVGPALGMVLTPSFWKTVKLAKKI